MTADHRLCTPTLPGFAPPPLPKVVRWESADASEPAITDALSRRSQADLGVPDFAIVDPAVRVYRNALYVPWTTLGGRLLRSHPLYCADGAPIAQASLDRRMRTGVGFLYRAHETLPAAVPTFPGRIVYVGSALYGYGHNITEGIGRAWALVAGTAANASAAVLLQPFDDGIDASYVRRGIQGRLFRALGVSRTQFVVPSEPMRFDELVVPEAAFLWSHAAAMRQRAVWDRIAEGARRPRLWRAPRREGPNRLYLSRARLKSSTNARTLTNERAVEDVFRRFGFAIVYPERLSFAHQLALYRGADVFAGMAGSALHNVMFAHPDATVIQIIPASAPHGVKCQHVIGAIRGARTLDFVADRLTQLHQAEVELPRLEAFLDAALRP